MLKFLERITDCRSAAFSAIGRGPNPAALSDIDHPRDVISGSLIRVDKLVLRLLVNVIIVSPEILEIELSKRRPIGAGYLPVRGEIHCVQSIQGSLNPFNVIGRRDSADTLRFDFFQLAFPFPMTR